MFGLFGFQTDLKAVRFDLMTTQSVTAVLLSGPHGLFLLVQVSQSPAHLERLPRVLSSLPIHNPLPAGSPELYLAWELAKSLRWLSALDFTPLQL